MARPTYKAGARLKGFAVKGEFKTNSEGVVVSEPELVITLSVPVDEVTSSTRCGHSRPSRRR